jgi:hypothetical protein
MRPAPEAGLRVQPEAADPYMRQVLEPVSKGKLLEKIGYRDDFESEFTLT